MIFAALVLDIVQPRRQIERMKQAAIGVMHMSGVGPVERKEIAARRFSFIMAEAQQTGFVVSQALWRGREIGISRKLARQI